MCGNKILLTGAGFSHNFGLPLARNVWAMIFNDFNIQKSPKIRHAMLQNYDYEDLYGRVLVRKYPEDEKAIFLNKVDQVFNDTFEKLTIVPFSNEQKSSIDFHDLRNFIKLFTKEHQGYLFTLNQDLFLERLFLDTPLNFLCPFIGNPIVNVKPTFNLKDKLIGRLMQFNHLKFNSLWQGQDCALPSDAELAKKIKEFENCNNTIDYFKLHGSIGWRDPANKKAPLVMGTHKMETIKSTPILKEYLERFKTVLSEPNSSILIIGYGFADAHINEIIFGAVKNNGLKLHILSPESIIEFKNKLEDIPQINDRSVREIYHSIYGYYETTLEKVFPCSGNYNSNNDDKGFYSQNNIWKQISSNFFEF